MKNNYWIVGCGDIGQRVANLLTDQSVYGVVQSDQSLKACHDLNINAIQRNFDQEFSLPQTNFNKVNVFYFMPPPPQGREDSRLQHFLNKAKNNIERLVLISTTGVYGDSQGDWIDESTPVNPIADRAYRRLSAEQTVTNWATKNNKSFIILRVPGIYANDRLPLARLKKGLPVVKESEAGFTNRIHADDLATACKLAMESDIQNEIINVTDGNPSTMTAYFNQVADYAGLTRPPQISMQEAKQSLSAGMVSYLKESRRIKNTKMLNLLKIKLKYPDLQSALSQEKNA